MGGQAGLTGQHEHGVRQGARERLLGQIPLAERRRELAGVSTAVLEGGKGPPMVLLHGAGEFAGLWWRVIPRLLESHRVIVPDLPGHGASASDEPFDAEAAQAWLAALIEATCSTPPVMVARTLGGALAARFVAANGRHVGHLILVDTWGLAALRPALRFAVPTAVFMVRPTARSRDRMIRQCFVDFDDVGTQVGDAWGWVRDYGLDQAKRTSSRSLKPLYVPLSKAIPSQDLARITVPTVLIHGREDLQVRLGVAERASQRYGWPLHVIDGARDDVAIEQPQAFVAALRTALGPQLGPSKEEAP